MGVLSVTVCLVRFELADIDISLGMPERSLALSLIVDPLAFINCTVHPFLYSVAISFLLSIMVINSHLALVHASVWEDIVVHEEEAWNVTS